MTINLLEDNTQKQEQPKSNLYGILIARMEEVITGCMTLKSRIDMLEEHVAFLLSQNKKYKTAMKKAIKAADNEQNKTSEVEQIS